MNEYKTGLSIVISIFAIIGFCTVIFAVIGALTPGRYLKNVYGQPVRIPYCGDAGIVTFGGARFTWAEAEREFPGQKLKEMRANGCR